MWAFMPKYHCSPFFVWCISGSRSPSWFLVELGAEMIVASTIVPRSSIGYLTPKAFKKQEAKRARKAEGKEQHDRKSTPTAGAVLN
jgi:hypothetical protein